MNINRFMINMDQMARSDKFEVEIFGPAGIRSRGIRCTDVSIPAKSIGTVSHSYLSAGPVSTYADSVDYGASVNLTFMLDHTYEVELHQCFPTTLSEIAFTSGATEIQTFSADFAFRSWSSSFENSPGGLLGGLFNKFSRKLSSKVNKKLSDKLFG